MNLPLIIPIVSPLINWNDLVASINEKTGRSPTRLLKRQVGDLFSYLQFVSSFSTREIGNLDFNQLSFSFLMELTKDEYIEILKCNYLDCVDNLHTNDPQLLVISAATLRNWRHAIDHFTVRSCSFRVRYIFDCIALYFEKNKLITITKTVLPDKTLIITIR